MTEFTTWRSLVDGAEIAAIPDEIDNYDRYEPEGDIDITTVYDSGSSVEELGTTTSPVFEGVQSLELAQSSAGTDIVIAPDGSLLRHPNFGEDIEVRAYTTGNATIQLWWGDDNTDDDRPQNGVSIGFNTADGAALTEQDDASLSVLDSESVSLPNDEWMRFELKTDSSNDQVRGIIDNADGDEIYDSGWQSTSVLDGLSAIGFRSAEDVFFDAPKIIAVE